MHEESLIFTLSVSHNISSIINEAYSITEELSANNDISSFNPSAQEKVLVETAARHPEFDHLYIQNIDGWQTANSKKNPGIDRSQRWWFKEFKKIESAFVSKSYYTITDDSPITSIFMPVYSNKGLVGILGTDLKLSILQNLVERLGGGKGGYTYVLDGQGTVIAHPNKKEVRELYNYKTLTHTVLSIDSNGKTIRDNNNNRIYQKLPIKIPAKLQEATLLALKGDAGTLEYKDLNGNDIICAYSSVYLPGQSQNWAVITVENKTAAMATATNIIKKNGLISILFLIVAVLVTYYTSGRITAPILLMDQQIKKITQGQLYEPLKGNFGKNEMGRLSQSFEDMRSALGKLHTEREHMFLSTIGSLVIALESKDIYTHSHSVEVAEIAIEMAAELGLSKQEQFRIEFAALLHDIGKIGIPDQVLHKQGSLTEEEWQIMQTHPAIGAKIIGTIPGMEDISIIIHNHHCRWDGKGYPSSIAGEDIPLGSRIIAIADAFQAMTSDRPYRKALSLQHAIDEITNSGGSQFDNQLVATLFSVVNYQAAKRGTET